MTDHWADIFLKVMYLSTFALPLLACIFMGINAYFTEKSGKSSTRFETVGKWIFFLWIVNSIAFLIFGIMAEWISFEKWEMWASFLVAVLISLVIWLISKKQSSNDDRNLMLFSLLFLALFILGIIAFIAALTGRY